MPTNKNLTIIGGGIGGLATCAALRQVGIEATVYERADELREVGAGISLWANAARVLKKFGLLDEVIAGGEPIDCLELKNRTGKIVKRIKINRYEVPAVGVHRSVLLDVLCGAIPPENIKLGKTLLRYENKHDKVVAHFADGTAVESDALIGADGLKSVVRARMKGDAPPIYRGYTIWRGVARFAFDNRQSGYISETFARSNRFGLLSIGGGRFYYYATHNQLENQTDSPAVRKARLLERFGGWHSPLPEVIRATADEHILQNDCYDREVSPGWTEGRVVLLGDAAHPTTPNMGQGGCLAIEDAAVLAKILASESHIETAFRRFEVERYPRAKFIVESSRRFGEIGQWQNLFAVGFRDVLMRLYPARLFEAQQRRFHGFET